MANRTQIPEHLDIYFAGIELYGDDFDEEAIAEWYADESEGYAQLLDQSSADYRYVYHALNERHGLRHLPEGEFANVLGLGSSYGEEFLPLSSRIRRLTIVDPSEKFQSGSVHGIPCTYVRPAVNGLLPFADASFDLITCLGTLHHIPNVSMVVRELFRTLTPGGHALIREPVYSMGDWTRPRPELTKRERGIPLALFRRILSQAGFQTLHENLCIFPPVAKTWNRFNSPPYNSPLATRLDAWLSILFRWNLRYHARNKLQQVRPTSVYYVLEK